MLGAKLSPKALGRMLREIRSKAGVTQVELGKRLGMPYQNISRLETGRHEPSLSTVSAYVRALGWELVMVARPRERGRDNAGMD